MRQVLLGLSIVCLVAGTGCFGVFLYQLAHLMFAMPRQEIEQLLPQVVPIQRWGWYFLGLFIGGFLILFFVGGRGQESNEMGHLTSNDAGTESEK